jgi:hypothetical protein
VKQEPQELLDLLEQQEGLDQPVQLDQPDLLEKLGLQERLALRDQMVVEVHVAVLLVGLLGVKEQIPWPTVQMA